MNKSLLQNLNLVQTDDSWIPTISRLSSFQHNKILNRWHSSTCVCLLWWKESMRSTKSWHTQARLPLHCAKIAPAATCKWLCSTIFVCCGKKKHQQRVDLPKHVNRYTWPRSPTPCIKLQVALLNTFLFLVVAKRSTKSRPSQARQPLHRAKITPCNKL